MTDKSSATLNEHDEGVFYRLRQKMNNKNYKQWDDHWNNNVPTNDCFTDYKHQATEWNAVPKWLQNLMILPYKLDLMRQRNEEK
tara:strand:+ start:666 stop:917 length:252 start_codon:yes stop_codon:yes gene_type:complete